MRLSNRKPRGTEASVLFVTLALAGLLILFMFYYLNLVSAQNQSVARSQAWNSALAAAEAGVEEALAHLNPGVTASVVDLSSEGWGPPVVGIYGPQIRTLTADSGYSVLFSTGPPLTIVSTGSVTVAAIPATFTRVVQALATKVPLFTTALAAKNGITVTSGGFTTDSFDSSNPSLSTLGQYDLNKTSTNGDVASINGPVSPGTINGDLYLGSSVNYSGNYTGNRFNDFNVDFPDVVLPVTSWQNPPGPLTINNTHYDHAFVSNGDYFMPDSGSIYVGTNVYVRIYVNSSTYSPESIMIAGKLNNSGKLAIFMTGTTLNIAADDTINQSGIAGNLNFYGSPSTTNITLTWNGNGIENFFGTIYAPSSDLTLNGGGKPLDFSGSIGTQSITLNGRFHFHFDENLLLKGNSRGYVVTSWSEL